jgi:hypothetical protein
MIDDMRRVLPLLVLLPAVALAAPPRHFELTASFVPAKKADAGASVAVVFQPLDPDVRVNESPAPRLRLDEAQAVLVDRQPPAEGGVPDYDPLTARYVDLSRPVLFPVGLAKGAPRGEHAVKANVVFFYCSHRENWCRRGNAEVTIPVTVR